MLPVLILCFTKQPLCKADIWWLMRLRDPSLPHPSLYGCSQVLKIHWEHDRNFLGISLPPTSLSGLGRLLKHLASRGTPFCLDYFYCWCVHVYMWVHMYNGYVEARDNPWILFLRRHPPVLFWDRHSHWLAGYDVPQIHLSPSHWHWDYKHSPPWLAFKHGS